MGHSKFDPASRDGPGGARSNDDRRRSRLAFGAGALYKPRTLTERNDDGSARPKSFPRRLSGRRPPTDGGQPDSPQPGIRPAHFGRDAALAAGAVPSWRTGRP